MTVTEDNDSSNDPKITNSPQSLKVIQGGTSSVTFKGLKIVAWSYGSLPDSIRSVEGLFGSDNNTFAFLVTASSTATIDDISSIDVYAYNEKGESAAGVINVTIVEDDTEKYPDPVITQAAINDAIKAGDIASLDLKGEHVTSWSYNPNGLSYNIPIIELEYDPEKPKTCKVIVVADGNAEVGSYTVDIYAYNEIGRVKSTTFTFTVSDSDDDTGSSKSSSSGCDTGVSSLTDLGVAGLLILIYYLVSRRRAK